MTSKVTEVQCSNEVNTTPRRLRSGTHYGDHNTQTQLTSKKENRRITKESDSSCDIDNLSKGDKCKASKHPIIFDDKQEKRLTPHMSAPPTVASPDQSRKNHTLKAILESIEPDLYLKLKNKPSKRKSLRDLLDQKLSRDKIEADKKGSAREQRKQYMKLEKYSLVNGENHNHFKSSSSEPAVTDKRDNKTNQEGAKKQTTMHTRTTAQIKSVDKIKEEVPDDCWLMTRNCLEKNSVKTSSSVELRIQAGHSRDLDDRSQTFRISCSRPEAVTSSPTGHPRNMKPDIVLKVRPRSSSLSALSTSSYSGYHGRLEAPTRRFSTITSVSLRSSSERRSTLESMPADFHVHDSNLHTHGVVLQEDCPEPKPSCSYFSGLKSFTVDQVDHQDLLEESKVPPVARTVELLSEPHDVHLNNTDTTSLQLQDYCQTVGSHHLHHHQPKRVPQDESSPDLRTPSSATFTMSKLRENERGMDDRESEKISNTEDVCGKKPVGSYLPKHDETYSAAMFFAGDTSSAISVLRERRKEGGEEEEEEGGWTGDCSRNPNLMTRSERTLDVKDTIEEAGFPRRRRKGRPSRRANTERRWHTTSLSSRDRQEEEEEVVGQEEAEEEDEEEEEWGTERRRGGGQWRREVEEGEERAGGGGGAGGLGRAATVAARGRSPSLERGYDVSLTPATSIPIPMTTTRKGVVRRQGEGGCGGRRSRKGLDLDTLWANPELDTHGFLLWASENRSEMEKRIPDASSVEVEEQLAAQWRQLPFSAKLHFLCRARDASTDHNKHAVRKKKVPTEKKETAPSDGRSVYEEFLRLPQERQKDLLRKWLRFFQKMMPRLEYQDFIGDFKKACKSLNMRPVLARKRNARLRNLDPSHYHMLFEKIRETRPRVISVYNKRKAREEHLLSQSFATMVRRLIGAQPWPFVRGCRSKVLGELLKDIQQLEVEEVLAQIDLPLSLTSADLADPFLDSKDLQDPLGALCPVDIVESDPISYQTGTTFPPNAKDHGLPRKGPTSSSATSVMTASSAPSGSESGELPESPLVQKVLDSLRHMVELPVLDQRCLDSIFLAPPSRGSRGQTCRDTQFQNSATYRRTLLYKHIQPLLDSRGMPLPSSALYHTHSAQYFYSDDR